MALSTPNKLKIMFALEFGSLGCFIPLQTLYLREVLNFSGTQVGWIQFCGIVSAIISPFVGAVLADRFASSNHLLGICHFFSAILIGCLPFFKDYPTVLTLFFLYQIAFASTVALCNAIAFTGMEKQRDQFTRVRVYGTYGWMMASWLGGLWLILPIAKVEHLFLISSVLSLGMAILSFYLPHRPLQNKGQSWIPTEAIKICLNWPMLRWILTAIGITCCLKFHYTGVSPQLKHQGMNEFWIPFVMSLAQLSEIGFMLKLPKMLPRWGFQKVMLAGATCMVLQFALLAGPCPLWLSPLAMLGHGFSFSLLMTPLIMHVDRNIPKQHRSTLHLLMAMGNATFSSIIGGLMAGSLLDIAQSYPWMYWGTPLLISIIILFGLWSFKFQDLTKNEMVPQNGTMV